MTSTNSNVYRSTRHTLRRTLAQEFVALAMLAIATAFILAVLADAGDSSTFVDTPSISTSSEPLQPPLPRMPGEDY